MTRRFECEAVLFDLDGVLVDSRRAVERTWQAWAKRHGLDATRVVEVAHGQRTEETVRCFAPDLNVEAEAAHLERAEVEDVAGVLEVDGADALLCALPPESWAVVTSGTRELATTRLKHAGLPIPRVLVCAEDVGEGKPEPEGYLRAATLLGAAPERCVVVEDTPAGIRAARAASMAVIALPTTHPASELSEADAVARALSDIRLCRVGPGDDGGPRLEFLIEGSV